MNIQILQGDCRETLKTIPDQSVNCCVTSPPYWGLRDYGTAKWEGGDAGCDHVKSTIRQRNNLAKAANDSDGGNRTQAARNDNDLNIQFQGTCDKCGAVRIDSQLGQEPTPELYVQNLVQVFQEVKRCLRDDGTVWLNLGDTYSGYHGNSKVPDCEAPSNKPGYVENMRSTTVGISGLKPKDLVGIPWLVAFALRADGWYLRQDIIWAKPNPMPESVTDRCTKSHEYIFLLSKSERYFYDHEAVKEPVVCGRMRGPALHPDQLSTNGNGGLSRREDTGTRNKRDVWTVTTKPYKGAHFATFPKDLIKPCILAGCPKDGTVLDPFGGSGTTGQVAQEEGRNAILCELNPDYIQLIQKRTHIEPKLVTPAML